MRFLLGPELFWLILYLAAALLARANVPPSKGLDDFIERCWFYIPMVSMLVFALWWIPVVEKRWLLTRVWIAGLAGGLWVLDRALRGYSQQGPGIGMAYLVGLILLFVVLVAGSIFVKIKF